MADAVKNSVHGLILFGLLRLRLPGLGIVQGLAGFVVRTMAAATVTAGLVWLVWHLASPSGALLGVSLAVVVGAIGYAALLPVLGLVQAQQVVRLARNRLGI
jgi:hypothetical protein